MVNQQNRQDDGEIKEIDLHRLAQALLKRAWLIVLISVVTAVAVYIYSSAFVTPMYRTGFKAIIYNRENIDGKGSTSTSDLTASVGLTYLYNEILTSRRVLTEAADSCGLNMSYSALAGAVSTSISEGAPVVYVYVSMTDPALATRFATAIAQVAPEYVTTLPLSSAMIVVDPPEVPTAKYAPNKRTSTLLGFMIGFAVACVAVIVADIISDKVSDSRELEKRYHVAIIGSIPDIRQAERIGYYTSNKRGKE